MAMGLCNFFFQLFFLFAMVFRPFRISAPFEQPQRYSFRTLPSEKVWVLTGRPWSHFGAGRRGFWLAAIRPLTLGFFAPARCDEVDAAPDNVVLVDANWKFEALAAIRDRVLVVLAGHPFPLPDQCPLSKFKGHGVCRSPSSRTVTVCCDMIYGTDHVTRIRQYHRANPVEICRRFRCWAEWEESDGPRLRAGNLLPRVEHGN